MKPQVKIPATMTSQIYVSLINTINKRWMTMNLKFYLHMSNCKIHLDNFMVKLKI